MNENKRYRITGIFAHSAKPKKHTECVRVVDAKNIIQALEIYRKRLRGVKKFAPVSIAPMED